MGGGRGRHIKHFNSTSGVSGGYQFERSPGASILYKTDLFKRFLFLPPGEVRSSSDPFDTSVESNTPTPQHMFKFPNGVRSLPAHMGMVDLRDTVPVNLGEVNRQLFGNREFSSTSELINGGKSPAYASLDPRNTITFNSIDHYDTHSFFKDDYPLLANLDNCNVEHLPGDRGVPVGSCRRFNLRDSSNRIIPISQYSRIAHIMHPGTTLHQLEDRVMTPEGAKHFEDLPEVRELQFRLLHLTANAFNYRSGSSGININDPFYHLLSTTFGPGQRVYHLSDQRTPGGPAIHNFLHMTAEEFQHAQSQQRYYPNSPTLPTSEWATVKNSLPGLTSSIHLNLLQEEGDLTRSRDTWRQQYYGSWAYPTNNSTFPGSTTGYQDLIKANPEFSGIPLEHFVDINRSYLRMAKESPEQHVEGIARAFGSLWDKFNNGTYKRHPNFWSDHAFSGEQTSSSSWDKVNRLLNEHFMGYKKSDIGVLS